MPKQTTFDLTPGRIARGVITNYRTAASYAFTFNPMRIREGMGNNLAEDMMPGASDVLLRWASGKARVIAFDLQLDAEQRIRRFGSVFPNAANPNDQIGQDGIYTIENELAFFEHFTYPAPAASGTRSAGADLLVLSLGTRYQDVLCVVEDINIEITMFTPDLAPTCATVGLALKRYVTETVSADRIYR